MLTSILFAFPAVGHTVRRCPTAEQQPEMDLIGGGAGTDSYQPDATTGEGGGGEVGGGAADDVGAEVGGWSGGGGGAAW